MIILILVRGVEELGNQVLLEAPGNLEADVILILARIRHLVIDDHISEKPGRNGRRI